MGIQEKNTHGVFVNLGASNHAKCERQEDDYYATSPRAVEMLLEKESFAKDIWECASGGGHISKVLEKAGYNVLKTDIIDREKNGTVIIEDFLESNRIFDGDIITNPPYKLAQEFVEKALDSVTDGHKVVMYLRLGFLEGKKRQRLFKTNQLKKVYVAAARMGCAPNGQFHDMKNECEGGAVAFAWFVWEKGYNGNAEISWFNDKNM